MSMKAYLWSDGYYRTEPETNFQGNYHSGVMTSSCNDFIQKEEKLGDINMETIWHTPEDHPEIYKHVLLYVHIDYTLFEHKYFNEYMVEGYCGSDYDTGELAYYDWAGDRIFGEECVLNWCELPK